VKKVSQTPETTSRMPSDPADSGGGDKPPDGLTVQEVKAPASQEVKAPAAQEAGAPAAQEVGAPAAQKARPPTTETGSPTLQGAVPPTVEPSPPLRDVKDASTPVLPAASSAAASINDGTAVLPEEALRSAHARTGGQHQETSDGKLVEPSQTRPSYEVSFLYARSS
jgi:hypothetical protein